MPLLKLQVGIHNARCKNVAILASGVSSDGFQKRPYWPGAAMPLSKLPIDIEVAYGHLCVLWGPVVAVVSRPLVPATGIGGGGGNGNLSCNALLCLHSIVML